HPRTPVATGVRHQRRVRPGCGQRHPPHHADARRRVPHPGQHGRGREEDPRDCAACEGHRPEGQVEGVQHRTRGGAGSREPDRVRAGHDDFRRRPQGKPRRARARRLPAARRCELDEAHALVQRGQPPRLQAGQPEAAHGGIDPAEGPHVLRLTRPTQEIQMTQKRTFQIYRYDPDKDAKPRMQTIEIELDGHERMLLDALIKLKAIDPSLSFRRSCREGVCGSDAMNINGKNGLACLTNMRSLPQKITLRPLPGLPVIRDLIVDMTQFFKQYESIKPYLVNDTPPPEKERLQSPEERDELNGLYECILCASCSTSCPSFWWNPDKFVGPAGLLQAYRFLADSRDQATGERLDNLEDPYRLFRCHTIMNCVDVCPKGLNS